MTATKSRTWIAGTVVLCLLISVASWFLLIGPKRAEAAELEQQTLDTQASNQQLEARIEQLKLQFAELPTRQAELAAIKQAMPEDPALPTLVRDLDAMATKTGVTLMTLAPGQPAAVASPAPATPAPAEGEAAAEGETEGESTEGEESEEPAEGAEAADPAAPAATGQTATPVGAGMVLVNVPVNLTVVGDFFKSELFLKELQAEMHRAFLVQSLTVQTEKDAEASGGKPATKNGDVTMTITGSVFVLKTAEQAAQTLPAAPTTTAP